MLHSYTEKYKNIKKVLTAILARCRRVQVSPEGQLFVQAFFSFLNAFYSKHSHIGIAQLICPGANIYIFFSFLLLFIISFYFFTLSWIFSFFTFTLLIYIHDFRF